MSKETEIAQMARRLAELGMDGYRKDIPWTKERDEATNAEWGKLHDLIPYETADSIADAAIKMGLLCRALRSYLHPSLPEEVWAYRLAESIHDDLETLTHHYAAMIEGRNPLKECAA